MIECLKKEKIAVIGTGQMGKSVCQLFAEKGYRVVLKSRAKNSLCMAIESIRDRLSKTYDTEELENILSRIELTTDSTCLKEADLVIETVIEDLIAKKKLFKTLSKVCKSHTILATNTSSLSVTELAEEVSNPGRFLGLHFFNPATKMKLVEIVCGNKTQKETIQFAKKITYSLGKTAIVLPDSPGFIVNRLLIPFLNEAMRLAEEGIATIEEIDTAVRLGLNHPMGPFELSDYIGLDACLTIMKNLHESLGNEKYEPCSLLTEKVHKGLLGRKSRKGFYDYDQ